MEASLLKKNQSIELTIEDLTHDGSGVGKIDGYPLFIPNTLPGEKVTAKIIKLNKNYGFARMETIESVSADRVEPPCAVYSKCGGCSLQHLSYDGQLEFKRNQVEETMKRIGKLNVEVPETLGMENPW
ncbi:class I SAM-dependent RNA methyltransferase, partial [Listeria monocytogenes]|nr:class I SAM-dependent RNA methyltransferase [Listeria monocytogenes]